MADLTYAQGLAESLPVCDESDQGTDLISLCDIVITGIEAPWQHFAVSNYRPENDGSSDHPWAILRTLSGARPTKTGLEDLALTSDIVRKATEAYLQSRLDGGMLPAEAARLVDGSYTDAVIADSILQFALYGEEVFG